MSQQKPVENGLPFSSNANQVRRLFLNSGTGFFEVANSKGALVNEVGAKTKIARIVDDHTPPTPIMKNAEIKISSAPSKIHSDGKTSYKISLRLLFPDKLSYNDFVFFCGNRFKYYDEKGAIYSCILTDSEVKRVEAGKRYDVKLQLTAIRKDVEDEEYTVGYTDLSGNDSYVIEFLNGNFVYNEACSFYFSGIDAVASFKMTNDRTGSRIPSVLAFYLTHDLTNSPLSSYYTFYHNSGKVICVPKSPNYGGAISFYKFGSGMTVSTYTDTSDHWAKNQIENLAKLNVFTQVDRNGNAVYTFRPNAESTRAEMAVVVNRLRKYLERMIQQ